MKATAFRAFARAIVFLTALPGASAGEPSRPVPAQGGIAFQGADIQALQADEFANPGMLWVARGERLWSEAGTAPACASCHGEARNSMTGIAAAYPKWDARLQRVVNLEERIESCRQDHQGQAGLAPESEPRLALSAFLASLARGLPIAVRIDGPAAATYERGAALYRTRMGQMNLACRHCHDEHWGARLLAERVSQGQPDGWPAYRIEWQTLASLQRRLRACFFGVRAAQPPYGSPDLVALELYLAHRARGLPLTSPGVRR